MITIKALLRKNEFYLTIVLIIMCIMIGAINPAFFSVETLFTNIKGATVNGIMAFGLLIVIISGGIDISFPAIAITTLNLLAQLIPGIGYTGNPIFIIVLGGIIGATMGMFNGFLVAKFQFNSLIVTLGTSRIFYGLMAIFLGLMRIPMPKMGESFKRASGSYLISVEGENVTTVLPMVSLLFVLVIILSYIILGKTIFGRTIYAVGANRIAAIRAGFPVKRVQLFVFAFSGFTAGLAGVTHGIQARITNPVDIYGGEMIIVAMVVLGGASLTGGKGSVWGTLVGIVIVTIANNSLILVGVPVTWQMFVLGMIILIGTSITSYQQLRLGKKRVAVLQD